MNSAENKFNNINPGIMRQALEQSASAIIITDAAGAIIFVNPKFTELTGYAMEELIGSNPKILKSGSTSVQQYTQMWQSLLKQGFWQGEFQNIKKNGDIYWAHECISVVKNAFGEITNFIAVEDDITQRKQVEQALTESEQRFRQMAEMTGEWLWEQDPDGYYIYSSIALKTILGIEPEQVIGKHYSNLLIPEDKTSALNNASEQGPFYALCNHYRHKDGRQIITESTGLPILNEQGELIKWRGVDRDITVQKHFQDALIDSEKRTRLIIESALNAIIIMDSDGQVTDWNHHAEKMFGWSKQEVIGRLLTDLIIPEPFKEKHQQGLQRFLNDGEGPILNQLLEQTARRRNGEEFPVEMSISPLQLGDSYIFSGFIHDITDRKKKEQQIRQAEIKLAYSRSEMDIARRIQLSLFPSEAIKTEDFEIQGYCLPADQVGGDYFDYFFSDDNKLNMVMADVSGHSIGPALFMVETRSALRSQANRALNPAQAIATLNTFLYKDLDSAEYFITLFYLQYNTNNHCLTFANAGHPPPLFIQREQLQCSKLEAGGMVLGVRQNLTFEQNSIVLAPGDLLLLYTDGLTEAENPQGDFFGLAPVCDLLHQHADQSPRIIIDKIIESLKTFCSSESFKDDVTLMLFKRW